MTNRINRANIAPVAILAVGILKTCAFYQADSTLASPSILFALDLFLYVSVFLSLVLAFRVNLRLDTKQILIIFSVLFYCIIKFLFSAANNPHFDALVVLMVIAYAKLDETHKLKVFVWFRQYMVVSAFCAILGAIAFLLQLNIPHETVPYYAKNLAGHVYINYYFTVIYYTGDLVFRACGLFNEPGYFGTFLALVLVQDNVNLKKISNLLLLIGGILSFSMAFFLLIILYYVYRYINIKTSFIILPFLLITFIFANNYQSDNELVQTFLDRFKISETGKMEGDTRTSPEFERFYSNYIKTSDALFGLGSDYPVPGRDSTASYKEFIVDYGFIGSFLIYFILFLSINSHRGKGRESLAFMFVFISSIYQRPYVFTLPYYIVIIGGLLCLKNNYSIKRLSAKERPLNR